MPSSFRRLLVAAAALLAFAGSSAPAASSGPTSARAGRRALAIEKAAGRPWRRPSSARRSLTRGLADVGPAEAARPPRRHVAIDFDVVTNSQGRS